MKTIQTAATRVAMTSLTALSFPAAGLAQSNIDPVDKWSWSENIGFMNWRDADGGAQGAVVGLGFLSGFVWGENIGWLNLGDGSPAGGTAYANTDGSDHGVNVLSDGFLDGLGWSENVGWLNFGTEPFIGADGARLEAGRLRGFAWGENVGWINLDDPSLFVALNCPSDFNDDGSVNGADLGLLLIAWGPGGGMSDLNGDGVVDGADLGLLLIGWGSCP